MKTVETGGGLVLGLDIGGSHISCSPVFPGDAGTRLLQSEHTILDSTAPAESVLESIASCINNACEKHPGISAVGIAFPGPFDYARGVCAVADEGGKFRHLFGLHVGQALRDLLIQPDLPVIFENDASCFAYGARLRYGLKGKRALYITLGTGLGSAFMCDGELITDHDHIPPGGHLYNQPFRQGIAEDFISTRWFFIEYRQLTKRPLASVKALAVSQTEPARYLFSLFGRHLGECLKPWLKKFSCNELVIGGNLAKARMLFNPSLMMELEEFGSSLSVIYADDTEDCIIAGAAAVAHSRLQVHQPLTPFRKTKQPLLPLSIDEHLPGGYDIFPVYHIDEQVHCGFDSLATFLSHRKTVVIDGYTGVLWEEFRKRLHGALRAKGKKVRWYDCNACLVPGQKLEKMLAPFLNGDDPVFGKRYNGSIADFFEKHLLGLLAPDAAADISIVYGTGAALSQWKGTLVYVDVPKNEIQYRMRAASVTNLGAAKAAAPVQMYKRYYFIDWPVLNRHKQELLGKIDCIADEQRIEEITWLPGDAFRKALDSMATNPVRVRPWFEPGVWGGDWMKRKISGLNQDEINYAWSFELITPENGIVIEGGNYLLEVSFDFLMYRDHTAVLGKAASRFGTEFPIRFDFLDTFNGGNLSVQCHPRTEYIRDHFGENFTQDETYYILDCEAGADVYLGFQEDVDPPAFRAVLEAAQKDSQPVAIDKFVMKHPAHRHDLYLIPAGTVHASGRNNLVLEISNTPYIFTFKMYDWLRLDLNGKPRPINIDHAFNNLRFERKGDYVLQHLISHSYVDESFSNGRKVRLPTHPEHFYLIDRYEFSGEITVTTNGHCHCCMLVQGKSIHVFTERGGSRFAYAETFIIPSKTGSYRVRSEGDDTAFLLVAYVKDDHCKNA